MGLKFVSYDSETVINNLVTQFERALGVTLQPSDERRIFLNQLAQVIVGINANVNETGNQVLLRYAKGEALDAIGEMFGVTRLEAGRAKCVLRFTLSEAQSADVTIPMGTRATPNGEVYFATTDTLVIAAGNTFGEVEAEALTDAELSFEANTIKYIVDNVQFLASVTNPRPTTGGADRESDDSLRERIRLVPETFSTAGCSDGYKYWAKSASVDVGDVVVYSPVNDTTLSDEARAAGAGRVYIYILNKDGSIPSGQLPKASLSDPEPDQVIKDVYNAVNDKEVRPLTDMVTVLPPVEQKYSINLEYYVAEEDEVNLSEIQTKVNAAITEYVNWQGGTIGRDINPDKLRSLILNAGAVRVEITSPATYQEIPKTHIAVLDGEITVTPKILGE